MTVTIIKLHHYNSVDPLYLVAENALWWAESRQATQGGAIVHFTEDDPITVQETPEEIVNLIENAQHRGLDYRPAPKIGG